MAKGKQEEAPAGSPAWMATFSDLMNLLLCFFVLLFSMSSTDVAKFNEVVASLQSAFSILPAGGQSIGDGTMVGSGISQLPELDVYFHEAMHQKSVEGEDEDSDDSGGKTDKALEEVKEAGNNESEQMAEEIEQKLSEAGIAEQVNIDFNEQYVRLTLNGGILFLSGQADLQKNAKPFVRKLTKVVAQYNENIIEVEGHTDNVPIHSAKFANNNVLSTFRALSVADYMKKVSDVNPALLKFSGRGSYVPVAKNTTAEGRAKNRRVEIKVYNSIYSKN
ncbi:MAG: chemotaxis protein [Lachnospiraceae bacterium]|jgi:chemotaxis protein MotB|nr:chemotaxis protein [Lachnospiraceae bacterium]